MTALKKAKFRGSVSLNMDPKASVAGQRLDSLAIGRDQSQDSV